MAKPNRSPQYIIKIAADDVTRLRRSDVFRVIDNCSDEEQPLVAEFIKANRPDLAKEVDDSVVDVNNERKAVGPVSE